MERIKILVVDDEARMRKLVKDFLSKSGYEVLEAEDGSQALDIFFEQNDIALIILDVMMPKMDGWQTCREIRQYSKVPIIMLTAKSDERDELQGFQLGVDEYISKPFLQRSAQASSRRSTCLAQISFAHCSVEALSGTRCERLDANTSCGTLSEQMVGNPAACASIATIPNPSKTLGNTKTSMAHNSSSTQPVVP